MNELAITGNVKSAVTDPTGGKTSSIRLRSRPSSILLRAAGKAHEITCCS